MLKLARKKQKIELPRYNRSKGRFIFVSRLPRQKSGLKKLVYRLIVMFLSTEIFSKRRKIYEWLKRNQSYFFGRRLTLVYKPCRRRIRCLLSGMICKKE